MIAPPNRRTVPTVAALAVELGRNERTVHRYLAAGMADAVRTPRGRFSVAKARAWIAAHVQSEHAPGAREVPDAELAVEIRRAELEKLREQARTAKLKNDLLAGRLIDRDDVVLAAAELLTAVRDDLLRLPDVLAPLLPADVRSEAMLAVDHLVRQTLRRLSQCDLAGAAATP